MCVCLLAHNRAIRPVILVILRHSHWSSQGRINDTSFVCVLLTFFLLFTDPEIGATRQDASHPPPRRSPDWAISLSSGSPPLNLTCRVDPASSRSPHTLSFWTALPHPRCHPHPLPVFPHHRLRLGAFKGPHPPSDRREPPSSQSRCRGIFSGLPCPSRNTSLFACTARRFCGRRW